MVTKVIHILTRSPGRFPGECPAYEASPGDTKPTLGSTNPGDYEHFIKITKFPHWKGLFQNDFHVKLAQEIVKTTDRYMVECWRFYWGIDKVYTKTISGIKHKLFPSKRVIIGKNYIGEISNQLIKELKEEIQEGKVIVHFHSVHKFSPNYILFQTNFMNTPLVVHN